MHRNSSFEVFSVSIPNVAFEMKFCKINFLGFKVNQRG